MKAYYKITSGPVFELVKQFATKTKEAETALRTWIKKNKLPVELMHGKALTFRKGYDPNREKPTWKKNKRGHFVPRENTISGKTLKAEMDALPDSPSVFQLVCDMCKFKGAGKDIMRINQTGYPGIYVSGDDVRLSIDDYWLPTDRTGIQEITASEYHDKQS